LGAGRYTRDHLGPWVRRRLTGTSSGDGRAAKHPSFITISPSATAEP
ncbi:MAG: GDSL family lipase, partial [Microbacterium sp.]|nr:GDSL family lipase [Microbacterium sp.]